MLPNFYVFTIDKMSGNNLLIGTSYGPLFLDDDDYDRFKFDPNWLVDNIDTDAARELLSWIKQYYIKLAAKLRMDGDLS